MARKSKQYNGGGASWMETYSDMVTLLLTFFIMLYAMSTIDSQKYAAIIEAFNKQMNPAAFHVQDTSTEPGSEEDKSPPETVADDDEANLDQLYAMLRQYIDENDLTEQVELQKSEEYVFIRFSDSVTFRGYSDILEMSGRAILDVLADGLTLVDEYIEEVIIAGHTAEVEYDKTDIDRSLSTDRANVVLRYLENKEVIHPSKYLAIGYGLYSPIADNSTPEGRAKNRRVEIYISRKGYPVSYTKIIQDTINKEDIKTENVDYQQTTIID
ncbi:flagellar motor protein MotB [Sedimentibacter sp.]|uniref:flagellar motor protein MotB n=1 Tax=Sedimentibacter sp. TaxID=1960295 RepID=UPI00289EE06B|nr:flagellar motor protein MotB [Sedimentibacter sp.]